jgi:hypothetical protein
MFEIEFVAVRDEGEPQVLETVTSNFVQLVEADKKAKALLERVRRKRRALTPDGYQIRARDGRVVLRYLERPRSR